MPKDSLNQTQMAANYGFALAFLNSDKELKALFSQAVKKGWEPQMFVARLRATKWGLRSACGAHSEGELSCCVSIRLFSVWCVSWGRHLAK